MSYNHIIKPKTLLLCSTLTILQSSYAWAANISSAITPDAQLNMLHSARGPIISPQELNSLRQASSSSRIQTRSIQAGHDTSTYVRCYYNNDDYQLNPQATNPTTNYEWALTSDGSYYQIYGYWHSDFNLGNMFYTSTNLQDIETICNNTIKRKHGNTKFSFYQVAANNQYSYNQTIWQNNLLPSNQNITSIIAFGDSLSDNNNMYNASFWKLPNRNSYFQGRFTNGYTWVEYLSKSLHIPLYNWAVGGAKGQKQYMVLPGLNDEIKSWSEYITDAKGFQIDKTLFSVWIGANDLNDNRNPTEVAQDFKLGIQTLLEKGARYILIMNLPDLSLTPQSELRKIDKQTLHNHVVAYNNQIATIINQFQQIYPDRKLIQFDAYSKFNDMIKNPALYNINETTTSCLDINSDRSLNYTIYIAPRKNCTDASKFIFWDLLHPTTYVHSLIANEVLSKIQQEQVY